MAGPNQCEHTVRIGGTDLEYCCCAEKNHSGPHHIAISSDFCLCDSAHDKLAEMGLTFGICQQETERNRKEMKE